MNTNTPWERLEVGAETLKFLRFEYVIWSCLRDGEHIFRVEREGVYPSPYAGGYRSIDAALRQKGLR
jgi:hypothetical protein